MTLVEFELGSIFINCIRYELPLVLLQIALNSFTFKDQIRTNVLKRNQYSLKFNEKYNASCLTRPRKYASKYIHDLLPPVL